LDTGHSWECLGEETWSQTYCQRPLRYLQTAQNHAQKKTRIARERDPRKRAEFQEKIAKIAPERLVFLDESGFHLAMYLSHGWSARGVRLVEAIPFQRGKNFSVLGAFDLLGMVCTFEKEGSIKRVDLESFLEQDLLPQLEEGAVLVLDNAKSHHGGKVAEIVEAAGCSLLYLPPYSPDFNPIELAWGWIKQSVRRAAPRNAEKRLAEIQSAIARLPEEFGKAWFRKAGLQY
jgi:transposase